MWLGLLRQLLHRCLVLSQSFYESGSLASLRFFGSRLSTLDSTADENRNVGVYYSTGEFLFPKYPYLVLDPMSLDSCGFERADLG